MTHNEPPPPKGQAAFDLFVVAPLYWLICTVAQFSEWRRTRFANVTNEDDE